MSKKKTGGGIVYSTDPNFSYQDDIPEEQNTLPPAQQQLKVKLDTKQRAGKTVTMVDGFIGTNEDLEKLGKDLIAQHKTRVCQPYRRGIAFQQPPFNQLL